MEVEVSRFNFATINASLGVLKEEDISGLLIANNQFMNALLTLDPFAGYHYYIPDEIQKKFYKVLKKALGKHPAFHKIRIFPASKIKEYCAQYRYLVFHHGDPFNSYYFFVRQALCKQKFPISCFVHTFSGKDAPVMFVQNMLAATKSYDVIFSTSNALTEVVKKTMGHIQKVLSLQKTFNGEMYTIPFGVDINRFKPLQKSSVRKKMKIPVKAIIIGHIGRLTAWNKMDLVPSLIIFKEVLSQLRRKDVYYYIVGKEQEKGYVKLLKQKAKELGIQKRVKIITTHKNADIHKYYAMMDIFISPCAHVQETFGITPLEAMACGVPVVVSDWDGYKETVKNGETGYTIPTYWHKHAAQMHSNPYLEGIRKVYMQLDQSVAIDVFQYAAALLKLITDDELRQTMGKQARAWVEEKFNWETIVQKYISIWKEKYIKAQQDQDTTEVKTFYEMPYYDLFSHYPTRELSSADTVCATSFGRQSANKKGPIFIYEQLKGALFNDEVKLLIQLAQGKISVEELYKSAQKHFTDLGEIEFMQHLLWMIKYGYLTVQQ